MQNQPMSRQQRRAAERAAFKAARSAQRNPEQSQPQSLAVAAEQTISEPKPVSPAQLAANQSNAQLSTGPTSIEGKAKVSQNSLRHGLSGEFRLLSWEVESQFNELVRNLNAEYKPTNPIEQRLVDSMTQHFWLMQRAITLQDDHFTAAEFDQKLFSLYLRYQTTHERSYYKAMRELQNLRKEAAKQQNGFASQKRQQESHEAKIRLTNAKAAGQETDNFFRNTVQVPLPGTTRVQFDEIKDAFADFIRYMADRKERETAAKAA